MLLCCLRIKSNIYMRWGIVHEASDRYHVHEIYFIYGSAVMHSGTFRIATGIPFDDENILYAVFVV